jgi:hypothetical protein
VDDTEDVDEEVDDVDPEVVDVARVEDVVLDDEEEVVVRDEEEDAVELEDDRDDVGLDVLAAEEAVGLMRAFCVCVGTDVCKMLNSSLSAETTSLGRASSRTEMALSDAGRSIAGVGATSLAATTPITEIKFSRPLAMLSLVNSDMASGLFKLPI